MTHRAVAFSSKKRGKADTFKKMWTVTIFLGGELILVILWIIVLVFAFDFDCATEPMSARAWLLTSAFTHLLFDFVGACISGFWYFVDEHKDGTVTIFCSTLILNILQIAFFAVGLKILTGMECPNQWVLILAEVILGLALLRIPKVAAFLFMECRK